MVDKQFEKVIPVLVHLLAGSTWPGLAGDNTSLAEPTLARLGYTELLLRDLIRHVRSRGVTHIAQVQIIVTVFPALLFASQHAVLYTELAYQMIISPM